MKLGLYSITYLGVWYRGEALPLPEMIKTASKYGYDGIEIDGKRPHGCPLDWPASRCRELRSVADGEGIDIFAVAANNDFSYPVPEVREAQICSVRELIRMTADLGAPTLRVFLAWWGVTRHPTTGHLRNPQAALARSSTRSSLPRRSGGGAATPCRMCSRTPVTPGVTLALQNHKPVDQGPHDVVRMVKEVDSPHLKVCLDAPLMPDRSAAAIDEAAQRRRRPASSFPLRR